MTTVKFPVTELLYGQQNNALWFSPMYLSNSCTYLYDNPANFGRLEGMRLKNFENRVAVVTGGASGIGKGIARQLIRQGMHVVIADIEAEALAVSAAELGAVGIRTDVSDAASVQALADAVEQRFGRVHLVCNNAGIGPFAHVGEMTLADWQWMLGVNLWGVIHGIHAFLPLLRSHGEGGHIVNTASAGGFVTMPGLGAYSASKSAVVALSEALSQELAGAGVPVGVTVFCPGPVSSRLGSSLRNRPAGLGAGKLADVQLEDTELAQNLRWITPEEAGDTVIQAVREGQLYAFTHPEMFGLIDTRFEAIRQANARASA